MPARDILLALLVQAIWGLNIVVAKAGVEALPPLFFTTLRFALVAALVLPFFRIPWHAMKGLALLSFTFGTLHFGLLFTGLSGMGAAAAAIVIQLGPPFAVLLGVLMFKEKLGPKRIVGTVLAFSGVVLLAGEPTVPSLVPLVLMVFAAFGWALSNVVVKRLPEVNPVLMTGWLSAMAVPQVGLLSLLLEDGQIPALISADWRGWGAIVYTAAGASIVAHSLWYGLVRRHEMGQVAPFGLLAPVIGIVAAVLLLGEPLTWQKLAGGTITMVGVAIIQLRWARLKRRPPEEVGSPT
ncbi:DMT family transporter [Caenispirillum salinarum]|uniref:DMT family transporter n=1 Tax=Caenispirillum salinarum TaxID=859058 RepID=UPI00384EF433